jgi:regulator of protease activity HflC (stomatin/prohibitin superfamily)
VADADKYEKLTVAQGEAEAIETVFSAIHKGDPTNDLIAIKYLEALQKIADGNATKIYLPLETSGILGSIGGIGDLFKETNNGGEGGKAEEIVVEEAS